MSTRELLASSGAGIVLVDEQIITVSGNWLKAAGVKPTDKVLVSMWGGGGSGCKGGGSIIGGGLGGLWIGLEFFAFELPSSVPCVVGAGASGVTADGSDGLAGGFSSFGGFVCLGGTGGRQGSGVNDSNFTAFDVDVSNLTQTVNIRQVSSYNTDAKKFVEFEKPSLLSASGPFWANSVLKAGANGGLLYYNGSSYATNIPNTSLVGGAGGIARLGGINAGNGQVPGGGGGAILSSGAGGGTWPSGAGARGEIRVRVLRGAS